MLKQVEVDIRPEGENGTSGWVATCDAFPALLLREPTLHQLESSLQQVVPAMLRQWGVPTDPSGVFIRASYVRVFRCLRG